MPKEKIITKRRVALAALVSGTAAAASALYLLATPVDLTRFHSRIESMVSTGTGREVRLERVVLRALPSPDLSVDGIEVYSRGEQVLSAAHMRVRVSLLPLLAGNTVIERLELKDASLLIRRDKEGRTGLDRLIGGKEEKGRTAVNSMYIENGSIRIIDDTASIPAAFNITAVNAYIYSAPGGFVYGAGGILKPSTTITFTGVGNPTTGVFSGTGGIEGLELGTFNPYFRKANGSSIDGSANAAFSYSFGNGDTLRSVIRYRGLKANFPSVLGRTISSSSGSAVLEMSWGEKKSIALSDVLITLPEFSLLGSFRIDGPRGKESVTLSASATPIPLKTFIGTVPVKLSGKAASVVSDLEPLGGEVVVHELTVSGPFKDLLDSTIFAAPENYRVRASLSDLSFMYRPFREAFTGFTGSVSLSKGVLSIDGMRGRYNLEEIKDFRAEFRDLPGTIDYKASVEASLDAGETLEAARSIVKGRAPSVAERLGRLRATGEAEAAVEVSGSVRGKAPFLYSGTAKVSDADMSYEGFAGSFNSSSALVGFDNRRITLKEAMISEGDSDLKVNGFVEDYLAKPYFDASVEGELTGNSLKKFLPPNIAAKLSIDGKMPVKASGSGTKDSFSAAAYIDTTGAAVEYKNFVKKAPDYTLSFEGYITLNGKELEVKRADLRFGVSAVLLAGDFSLDRPVYGFVVQANELKIADIDNLSPFLIREYESGGLVSFKLGAAKKSADARPAYQGVALVKDARFRSPLIAKPVERINAALMIEGNRASVKISGMKAGETSLSGTIDIPDIAGRVVDFDFASERLNTDDLLPKEAASLKTIKTKEAFRGDSGGEGGKAVTGSGRISIKEGSAWGHPFSSLKADVAMTPDAVVFSPLTLAIDGGRAEGSFLYYKAVREPLLFDTSFKITDIDLSTMFTSLGVQKKVLTGELGGEVRLLEKRGSDPFSAGLSGYAELESRKGKLWKGTVLTKIFSIVNIISIDELFREGLPYKTLTGDFSVDNGIISTENMALKSDSLSMSAVGEINVPERQIDSVIAVSPFVTVDKIVSQIPLAGWIITGKDQSVLSMYFGVEGKLNDPLILPKPITMIEKGVFGIFKRLLETPGRILEAPKKLLKPEKGKEKK